MGFTQADENWEGSLGGRRGRLVGMMRVLCIDAIDLLPVRTEYTLFSHLRTIMRFKLSAVSLLVIHSLRRPAATHLGEGTPECLYCWYGIALEDWPHQIRECRINQDSPLVLREDILNKMHALTQQSSRCPVCLALSSWYEQYQIYQNYHPSGEEQRAF